MAQESKTRFMIISDTHNYNFSDPKNVDNPLQPPLPPCDVVLHAGDLTYSGSVQELEDAVDMLGSIDAELRLVIAGNHDFTLDGPYMKRNPGLQRYFATIDDMDVDKEQSGQHEKAMNVMRGHRAQHAGVTYLEEGLHSFTLKSGATFTIYASPWQPEFCNMAFNYPRDTDRFNPPESIMDGVSQVIGIKVPDCPDVDIMMTHGPPHGIMDAVQERRKTTQVGCHALMTAVSRARPKLYCFGHIHEGHGAELVEWKEDKFKIGQDAIEARELQPIVFPQSLCPNIKHGKQTLMVNAAIMTLRYKPVNAPWLVDLDLPIKQDRINEKGEE